VYKTDRIVGVRTAFSQGMRKREPLCRKNLQRLLFTVETKGLMVWEI
jgi:hypothetical protein